MSVFLDKAVWHNLYRAMPDALITHEAEMYTLIDKSAARYSDAFRSVHYWQELQYVQAVNSLPEDYAGAIGSPIQILAVLAIPSNASQSEKARSDSKKIA